MFKFKMALGCGYCRKTFFGTGHLRFLFFHSFLNGPTTILFFVNFRPFQTNNTIFTTNKREKMTSPSSIRRWDLNP